MTIHHIGMNWLAPLRIQKRKSGSDNYLSYIFKGLSGNIQSERGILNRQIRSIQTEGHFGDIKENDGFRRFNYRIAEKVYKEFMLYAIGRNINKYHRFLHDEIKKFEGKTEEKSAQKKSSFENAVKGFLCPKIHTEKKKYESPEEVQVLKILISTGDSYFKVQNLKIGIN